MAIEISDSDDLQGHRLSPSHIRIVSFLSSVFLWTYCAQGGGLELVRYTDLWKHSPARIADAAGVTYLPDRGHLLISDSEISEYGDARDPNSGTPVFQNRNLFELSLDAREVFGKWMMVPPESAASEPVGVAWDDRDGLLYISDDDQKRLYCYQFNPSDSLGKPVASISTNCGKDTYSDPEGLAICPKSRDILVVSGTQRERVIRFKFDRAARKFKYVSEFSVGKHVSDPEGIAVHPETGEVFLISSKSIARFSTNGAFRQSYLYSEIPGWKSRFHLPGGATFAPSSDPKDAAEVLSLYVTCRGIDNGQFPKRNSLDGGLAELRLIFVSEE